jgi:hypothetical protein
MLTLREKEIELCVHKIKLRECEFVLCKHELVLGQQAAKEDWLLFFLLLFFSGDAQGQCYDNCQPLCTVILAHTDCLKMNSRVITVVNVTVLPL